MIADTADRLGGVGELLIRAAAALETIPPAELDALGTQGEALEKGVYDALVAAADLLPQVQQSLQNHGRRPFARLLVRVFSDG